ncbi:ATP-binding cassette domain-containing protein [Campylobacter geochelonis]|uniref:ATP-binding cassette domain-containing protein n=1 Tax=Campylobacter geochelonis TaxID=1780362 RepID=UPI000770A1E6|nr:ATP-binding cassette domain-containing protein [Campylobacter geochelonis]CZE45889.1 ABC transporter ATP-binding protein YojI [Campylobacter geochelonis]
MKRKYTRKFIIIFALTLLYSAFNIGLLAFINSYILSLENADYKILLFFIALLVGFFLSTYVVRYIVASINNSIVYELRVRFVMRVINSKMIFDEKKPKILASLSKDISSISNGFMRLSDALQGAILLFLSFFYFAYLSKELSLFVIVWFCLIGVFVYFLIDKARKNYTLSRQSDDMLYKDYEDLLGGFKELRINQKRSNHFLEQFFQNANLQKTSNTNAEIYGSLSGNFINVMMLGGIGIVMYLCLAMGVSDFKTATTVCLSMMFLRAPFMMMIASIPSILVAKISLDKIKELNLISFDEKSFSQVANAMKWQKIELKNISFAYDDKFVLKDVNLEIKKGEILFLVGENGSGKSTLFLLLCGLLRPSSGEILVDGKVLDESMVKDFQNSVSVVFSDFYLMGEILEKDDEVFEFWLKTLKMQDKVSLICQNDKAKFSSLNLSLGQRKRLALLQALLEKKDFLMLDEFAADQDPEFRNYFYNQILPLLKKRGVSVFAISHDDRYFEVADKVYKIQNGKVSKI